ncbi:MAG TPA: hypothetical protein IAB10_01040 [Candidatus Avilachnospira avistercoris]|nr:hypothetical protein [Candidatus Avilachnospira avistercoris]
MTTNRRNTNRKQQSRRKRQRAMTDAFKLVLALLLIIAAAAVVIFVRKELGSHGIFGNEETEASESPEETGELIIEEEPVPGFNEDADGRIYYLDEDGKRLSDTWLSAEQSLYYIDADGYVRTEDMKQNGMGFSFDEDGAVSSIAYDPRYVPTEEESEEGLFSPVRDRRVVVCLSEEDRSGSFYLIRYRRTTEDNAHDLGGDNKQYASPYSMQIDGNYIYYLPYTDREEPEDSYINKNLYRIQLGATIRELVAEDVEGYKVVDGDIYYQKSGRIYMTRNAGEDTTVPDFSEVEDFRVDISSGDKAFLYTGDGRLVAMASEEFKAGNFRYELSADGEILSVKEKTTVNTGGYTYSIEGDEAFGKSISRVARTSDADGKKEIISAEFDGSCGNVHYDFDSGYMYAEYTDGEGKSRILKISKDGDVDYLLDDGGDAKLKLYALQDNRAVCRAESSDGSVSFVELRLRASVPMALAVEPEELEAIDEPVDIGESSEFAAPEEPTQQATEPTEGLQNIEAPTSLSKDTPVAPQGPGAGLSAPSGEGSDITSLGPGGSAVGAPPG